MGINFFPHNTKPPVTYVYDLPISCAFGSTGDNRWALNTNAELIRDVQCDDRGPCPQPFEKVNELSEAIRKLTPGRFV